MYFSRRAIFERIFLEHVPNGINQFFNTLPMMRMKLQKLAINLVSGSYFSDVLWFVYKFLKFTKIRVNFGVPQTN